MKDLPSNVFAVAFMATIAVFATLTVLCLLAGQVAAMFKELLQPSKEPTP